MCLKPSEQTGRASLSRATLEVITAAVGVAVFPLNSYNTPSLNICLFLSKSLEFFFFLQISLGLVDFCSFDEPRGCYLQTKLAPQPAPPRLEELITNSKLTSKASEHLREEFIFYS